MSEGYVEAIEAAAGTELDRLGSGQYLVAVTGATLEPPNVLAAAVDRRYHAWRTFEQWADDSADQQAGQTFFAAAERERQARGKLSAELQSFGVTHAPPAEPDALQAHLRDVEGTVDRIAAGLLGGLLVTDRTFPQYVSFFEHEGDTRRADIFRDIRTDLARGREMGEWLLAEGIDGEVEKPRVRSAGLEAIQAAYDEYAAALENLGLDPRPTC